MQTDPLSRLRSLPAESTDLTPSTRPAQPAPKLATNRIQPTTPLSKRSSQEAIRTYLIENHIIDEEGRWIMPQPPPLPKFNQEKGFLARTQQLFDTPTHLCAVTRDGVVPGMESTLGIFLDSFKYAEKELGGSGCPWLLGEAFFKKFLLDLGVPKGLLSTDLFKHLEKPLRDGDFFFYSPWADLQKMYELTTPFFANLSELLAIEQSTLTKTHTLKWYLKGHESNAFDQYATATVLCKNASTELLVDCVFYLRLRKFLNTRDAFSLHFPARGECTLVTVIGEIRQAIIDFILDSLATEHPSTMNKVGAVTSLVSTIKGYHPRTDDYFPSLSNNFKEGPNATDLFCDLHYVTAKHYPNHPDALPAAIFNCASFLDEATAETLFNRLDPATLPPGSFITPIFETAAQKNSSLADVQSLLSLHTFLGMGSLASIHPRKRLNKTLVELEYHNTATCRQASLFLHKGLEEAVSRLCTKDKWEVLSHLATQWLESCDFSGLPLPDGSLDPIHKLLAVQAPAAQRLGFFLLLKWLHQSPSEGGLLKALATYHALLPSFSDEQNARLFDALMHIALERLDSLHKCLLILKMHFKAPLYADFSLALNTALLHSQHPSFCRLALQNMRQDPTDEDQLLLLSILEDFSDPGIAMDCLLEFHSESFLSPQLSLPLFTKLIDKMASHQAEYHPKMSSLDTYLAAATTALLDELDLSTLQSLARGLKKISPQHAGIAFESCERSFLQNINVLGKKAATSTDISEDFYALQQQLKYPYAKEHKRAVRQTLLALYKRAYALKRMDLLPTGFILGAKVQALFEQQPLTYLAMLANAVPFIEDHQHSLQISACIALAERLSLCDTASEEFLKGVETLEKALQSLYSRQVKCTENNKKLLGTHLSAIFTLQAATECTPAFYALLTTSSFLCVPLCLTVECGQKILDLLAHRLSEKASSVLANENIYAFICQNLDPDTKKLHKQKHTPVFIYAYLQENPVKNSVLKAYEWAMSADDFHPSAFAVVQSLCSNKLWKECRNLLTKIEQQLPPSPDSAAQHELALEWIKYVKAAYQEEPFQAVSLLVDKQSFFLEILSENYLQDAFLEIADFLFSQKHENLTKLALKLLTTYRIYSDTSLELLLQFASAITSKGLSDITWQLLYDNYFSQAPLPLKIQLMQGLLSAETCQPAWLPWLDDAQFAHSPCASGTAYEISTVKEILFKNVLIYVKENESHTISFDRLNAYRQKYAPNYSEKGLILECLRGTSAHLMLEVLQHIHDEEIPFKLSAEFLVFLQKHVLPMQSYIHCSPLIDLINKGFAQKAFAIEDLTLFLPGLIPLCLALAHQHKNKPLVQRTFSLLEQHRYLLTTYESRKMLMPYLICYLPKLLEDKSAEALSCFTSIYTLMQDYLDLSFVPIEKLSIESQKKAIETNILLQVDLVKATLHADISGSQNLYFFIDLCFAHIDAILKHLNMLKTKKLRTSLHKQQHLKEIAVDIIKNFLETDIIITKTKEPQYADLLTKHVGCCIDLLEKATPALYNTKTSTTALSDLLTASFECAKQIHHYPMVLQAFECYKRNTSTLPISRLLENFYLLLGFENTDEKIEEDMNQKLIAIYNDYIRPALCKFTPKTAQDSLNKNFLFFVSMFSSRAKSPYLLYTALNMLKNSIQMMMVNPRINLPEASATILTTAQRLLTYTPLFSNRPGEPQSLKMEDERIHTAYDMFTQIKNRKIFGPNDAFIREMEMFFTLNSESPPKIVYNHANALALIEGLSSLLQNECPSNILRAYNMLKNAGNIPHLSPALTIPCYISLLHSLAKPALSMEQTKKVFDFIILSIFQGAQLTQEAQQTGLSPHPREQWIEATPQLMEYYLNTFLSLKSHIYLSLQDPDSFINKTSEKFDSFQECFAKFQSSAFMVSLAFNKPDLHFSENNKHSLLKKLSCIALLYKSYCERQPAADENIAHNNVLKAMTLIANEKNAKLLIESLDYMLSQTTCKKIWSLVIDKVLTSAISKEKLESPIGEEWKSLMSKIQLDNLFKDDATHENMLQLFT